jgi:tripartite-type tricarboxylate transporter receptor subunit TctC
LRPPDIITRLNAVVVKALNDPTSRTRLASMNAEAIPSTPAEFTAYIRSEIAKWSKVVKAAGIKAD